MTQTAVTDANGEYFLPQPLVRNRDDRYLLLVNNTDVGSVYPVGVVRGSRVVTTDRDGWYQIDFGCSTGSTGFNTTSLTAVHPDYNSQQFSGGRGFQAVRRDDVALTRR
jgi:hypothetical protein